MSSIIINTVLLWVLSIYVGCSPGVTLSLSVVRKCCRREIICCRLVTIGNCHAGDWYEELPLSVVRNGYIVCMMGLSRCFCHLEQCKLYCTTVTLYLSLSGIRNCHQQQCVTVAIGSTKLSLSVLIVRNFGFAALQ